MALQTPKKTVDEADQKKRLKQLRAQNVLNQKVYPNQGRRLAVVDHDPQGQSDTTALSVLARLSNGFSAASDWALYLNTVLQWAGRMGFDKDIYDFSDFQPWSVGHLIAYPAILLSLLYAYETYRAYTDHTVQCVDRAAVESRGVAGIRRTISTRPPTSCTSAVTKTISGVYKGLGKLMCSVVPLTYELSNRSWMVTGIVGGVFFYPVVYGEMIFMFSQDQDLNRLLAWYCNVGYALASTALMFESFDGTLVHLDAAKKTLFKSLGDDVLSDSLFALNILCSLAALNSYVRYYGRRFALLDGEESRAIGYFAGFARALVSSASFSALALTPFLSMLSTPDMLMAFGIMAGVLTLLTFPANVTRFNTPIGRQFANALRKEKIPEPARLAVEDWGSTPSSSGSFFGCCRRKKPTSVYSASADAVAAGSGDCYGTFAPGYSPFGPDRLGIDTSEYDKATAESNVLVRCWRRVFG